IQLEGPAEVAFGARSIPVVLRVDNAERSVRFGERTVDLQWPRGCRSCPGDGFARLQDLVLVTGFQIGWRRRRRLRPAITRVGQLSIWINAIGSGCGATSPLLETARNHQRGQPAFARLVRHCSCD